MGDRSTVTCFHVELRCKLFGERSLWCSLAAAEAHYKALSAVRGVRCVLREESQTMLQRILSQRPARAPQAAAVPPPSPA